MREQTNLTVTPKFLKKIRCKLASLQYVHDEIRQRQLQMKIKIKLDPLKKPIMAPTLEAEIEAALVQFDQQTKWKEWGLDNLRKQGNCVLMFGPPGTGKTTIAHYMSKRLGRGLMPLNMKDFGGKAPGDSERGICEAFNEARCLGGKTVFLDECEAIIWDRGRAGSDSMWMVGVIDELLMQIAKYPYLVVLASNRPDIIDSALLDRCFASLQVGMPEAPERIRLWRQKMPERFPLKLTQVQIEILAEVVISGRQIENVIVREASMAIHQKREPSFQTLLAIAKEAQGNAYSKRTAIS